MANSDERYDESGVLIYFDDGLDVIMDDMMRMSMSGIAYGGLVFISSRWIPITDWEVKLGKKANF